ncbi:CARDB domain-containing protein [Natronosalvus vescus]|uniref:CARDB domain-containing protein n=1 Tax=Natronosalvus vescus TaxID=2953881 RepID=UPI00209095D3|nr:CARDB domain-containing protein [Natronosalvus vescus]
MKRVTGLLLTVVLLAAGIGATSAGVLPPGFDGNSSEDGNDRGVDTLEEIDDLIATPSSGPNGDYVVIDEDGHLMIDLTSGNPNTAVDGVPPSAFTGIDDVFELEYTGSEGTTVWIETDDERLEFHTESGVIGDEENATVLGPNERVAVGFSVDSEGLEAGDQIVGTFTVHATIADSRVYVASPRATIEIDAPDNVTRVVTIEHARSHIALTGDAHAFQIGSNVMLEELTVRFNGRGDPTFTLDAAEVAEHDQRLERLPSETGTVEIGSYTVRNASEAETIRDVEYRYAIDRDWLNATGADPETITVHSYDEEADRWEPSDTTVVDETAEAVVLEARLDVFSTHALTADAPVLTVTDLALEPSTVTVGEAVTVTTTIENSGRVNGTDELAVTVDGDERETIVASVDAGVSVTETFELTIDEPGEYEIGVGDAEPVTLTVLEADEPTAPDTGGDDEEEEETVETPDEPDERGEPIEEEGGFGALGVAGLLLAGSIAFGTIWRVRHSR